MDLFCYGDGGMSWDSQTSGAAPLRIYLERGRAGQSGHVDRRYWHAWYECQDDLGRRCVGNVWVVNGVGTALYRMVMDDFGHLVRVH